MSGAKPRAVLPRAFDHVVIGVRSLGEAVRFWTGDFGFELRARRPGPDAGLERLWDLDPGAVAGQAVVATPGSRHGALHLVEFRHPGEPVRAGAEPFDLLPKNLDLYARDLPARFAELSAAGHRFRSPWAEMPGPGGLKFREVHLPGHDGLNVVLLEVIGAGYDTAFGPKGFAGIGPLVTIVPDCRAEAGFYGGVLGMDLTLDLVIEGPAIEKVTGLPPGSGLDLRVYGDAADPLGRIEMIEYRNVTGMDRYARARPPTTGVLHVVYRVGDLAPLRERLAETGIAVRDHGPVALPGGDGSVLSLRSPAGFRLEVQGPR